MKPEWEGAPGARNTPQDTRTLSQCGPGAKMGGRVSIIRGRGDRLAG